MCGITGQLCYDTLKSADGQLVKAMNALIGHRGPDDEGYFVEKNIALGHKRLSIIDLNTGKQPIIANDNLGVIVFNGEIYNFPELKKELEKRGYTFSTKTDTEVVLYSWLEWGPECFNRFNGEWALAIWMADKQELIISRDRYGIKPLYYFEDGESITFSSEIKSLFKIKSFDIDQSEVWDQLVFGPKAGGKTIYKGITELDPGCFLTVKDGSITQNYYYSLADTFLYNNFFNTDEIEDLLIDSIDKRLMSDVPIGTLNSGGIDSSLISVIAKEKINTELFTFSVAPEKKNGQMLPGDESNYAEAMAKFMGSKHTTIRYSSDIFLDDLKDAIYINDLILYHPNSIPLSYLFKEIKQKHNITVLLGGEGADEVFRGYSYNKLAVLYNRYGSAVKRLIESRFSKLQATKKLVDSYSFAMQMALARNAHLSPEVATRLTGVEGNISEDRIKLIDEAEQLTGLDRLIFYEQKCYLTGLLQRIDRMSLRWGIEARVPFLDHRIVNYINSIKPGLKSGLTNSSLKKILKKIGSKHLPESIIDRKKYGFAAPIVDYSDKINDMLRTFDAKIDLSPDIHQRYIMLNYYLLNQ